MTKLSHSAVNKYGTCPTMFNLHYNHKIRPTNYHAALPFGTAIDAGVTALLKNETLAQSHLIFIQNMKEGYINGDKVSFRENINLTYSNSDFDKDLLNKSDLAALNEEFNVPDILYVYNTISHKKETVGYDNLENSERLLFNVLNWESLIAKGYYLLKAFKNKIMPNIEKVYETQKKIVITNAEGDAVEGYVDLICKWKDIGDIVIDLKTSSMDYDKDSVKTSQQLSLYAAALGLEWAGYVVLKKRINHNKTKVCSICGVSGTGSRARTCAETTTVGERCGGEWKESFEMEGMTQVIIDKITDRAKDLVMENFGEVLHGIKQEVYPKNLNACNDQYGKPCPYRSYCWNGKMDGLEKVGKK